MRKVTTSMVAAAAAATLVLTGCSTKASDSGSGGGGGGSGELKTDFGVTDDTITLGVQTDQTGVFKVGGIAQTAGNQLWADDVNADGGICGRDIKIDVQDNGYKPDNALPLYDQQKQNVAGYVQLLGSPILAALKQKLTNDKILAVPASWASSNLDTPSVVMVGSTYDVEMINGLSWMQEQGMIAEGDQLGHIYVDSEYGQNGVLGSEWYAEQNGMTINKVAVSGTDNDMTAIVAKMKADGVKAILLTTTPGQTASVATQTAAQAFDIPLLGSNPTFAPTLMDNDQVVQALNNYYVVTPVASMSNESEFIAELTKKYQDKYSDPPFDAVLLGYAYGMAWQQILEQACEDGDMTRDGLLAAREKLTEVDTKGLTGVMDFSKIGSPSTRQIYIAQADPNGVSGTKDITELYESDLAKEYKAPFQK
ncbi:ABC transporter substrate-binding protein [Epidermidibacterium keratini]|uniref:ABC transporter substrate-binding protein n=1 Tax=Epidermidibacterium keratini TaxID=1891644 RepID=A0A7L4YRC7_9ACTN|nr:ABC transporter substrate-binding protein [Epidermidibacterium keratini]QHC01117.1 ABC transporter substrate-binding protein [Epidermidibacterium keratini]